MKFNRSLLAKLTVLTAVLAPICFALRLYTYWNEINPNTGFFKNSGLACTIFNALALLLFFLCLALSLNKKGVSLTKKESTPAPSLSPEDDLLIQTQISFEAEKEEDSATGFEKAVSTYQGTLSAFSALFLALSFFSFGAGIVIQKEVLADFYQLALVLFAFLSGAFFLVFTFKNSAEKSPFLSFFALSPVIWCALRLLTEYRDLTRFMNKSLYVGQFLFVIAALVFFVYQAQFLLGDENLLCANSYAFNLLSLLFLGVTARIPVLVSFFADKVFFDLTDSVTLLVDLAITLFAGMKLLRILKNS